MTQAALNQPAPVRLIDITNAEFKQFAYPFYAGLRAENPVYRAKIGQMNAWLVTRYDDVLTVLKDPRFVKDQRKAASADDKRPWMPKFVEALAHNMLDQDDPNHARLRALVHKAFTPRRIEELQPRIQAIADQLLDAQRGAAGMDLIESFALPLPLTVIAELLGVPSADHDRFHRWSKAMLLTPTTFNMFRSLPAIWQFMRYMRRQLDLRRTRPSDDLLTALVEAEEGGDRLTADEQVAMVMLLLIAGHETTVNLITSGTLALLQHPDQLRLLREQPELIKSAIEELLRFTNPVETTTERFAGEDLVLGGQQIRRGELVLAVLASANRDERHFARPDILDITREKNRHLAFGYGIHFCLGAPLARMEGQIAISTLLRRLPDLRLAVPAETLRWRPTPIVRGLEKLPVAF
jgi:cytochrome P450